MVTNKMALSKSSIIILLILTSVCSVNGQRYLLQLKQDLEYRLNSYNAQRQLINDIITTSIYPAPSPESAFQNDHQARVDFTASNVRFTDLIVPTGSLILESHNLRPTIRMLLNKTRDFIVSKMNDLYQVKSQLDYVKHEVDSHQFIYKGTPNAPSLPSTNSNIIPGIRIFKQFNYGRAVISDHSDVQMINFTNVDHIINETYMANKKIGLFDQQSRLFFEGKKTFFNTIFLRNLRSGCCHRMKPIHTDRVMTRNTEQDIGAPIMLYSNHNFGTQSQMVINNLRAESLHNRILAVGLMGNRPGDNGLLPSPPENSINLLSLIHTRHPNQAPIAKTIVFKDVTIIDQAHLHAPEARDKGLVVGIASSPNIVFDLNHNNYLLRYPSHKNQSSFVQYVHGPISINGPSHFTDIIDASEVNGVINFASFVNDNLARIDIPGTIRGPIQFSALPALFTPPTQMRPNVPIMMVDKQLQVGFINGMVIPRDLIFLQPSPLAPRPDQVIIIRGPREFAGTVTAEEFRVNQKVNGLIMPDEVIPLHLNDFMSSVGSSNLMFLDGISAFHITIHGGQFDEILIRDADAQNIVMRSVFMPQPDGSHLVRAPLFINNLRLLGQGPDQGLINGFRPQTLLELGRHLPDVALYGRKRFINTVVADECHIGDINDLVNWPNHLVRIDRPNLLQNVHSRLIFTQGLYNYHIPPLGPLPFRTLGSRVDIGRLRIDFYAEDSIQHAHNWNLSPEFYMIHQALVRSTYNNTGGRYRITDQVRLMDPEGRLVGRINGISMEDVVTLDKPFRFQEGYVMVGKVSIDGNLQANRITSNYPLDVMDLDQFNQFRVPIMNSQAPIRLNSLVLGSNNRASFVQLHMLNGVSFQEFVTSIMSLTRPQVVDSKIIFNTPVHLEGMLRTGSSLNNINSFRQFADNLKNARYIFEDGLQCNSVHINA